MSFADPISSEESISSASWTELPCTYRDDEVVLKSDDPEIEEVKCNESDNPVHVDYQGKPYKISGSFIEIGADALKELLGFDNRSSGLGFSGNLHKVEKALKIETFSGKILYLPHVSGFVKAEISLGVGKVSKAPFEFTLKEASSTWKEILFIPKQGV